jgi:hypothetical protein
MRYGSYKPRIKSYKPHISKVKGVHISHKQAEAIDKYYQTLSPREKVIFISILLGILIIFLIIISNINHPINYQSNTNSYTETNKSGYIDGFRFTYSEKDNFTYVTLDNSITKKNKYILVKFMCDIINNIKGYNEISKIKYTSTKIENKSGYKVRGNYSTYYMLPNWSGTKLTSFKFYSADK